MAEARIFFAAPHPSSKRSLDVRKTLKNKRKKIKSSGELLRLIEGYKEQTVTRRALRVAPLVFVRPGDLRHAEWFEFDFDRNAGHGFRTMASTTLNEHGWQPDLIELQLAHAERNAVRAAYDNAQRLRISS